ncbi:MAG: TRAP transporter large permease [Planctomycetota bacterium]|nr:TRAP transporter large permease [Planctomycetota bacterium]
MITAAMLAIMVALMVVRVPVSIAVGVAALAGLLANDNPLDVLPRMMIDGVDSFAMLAVPFFVLAGQLMNAGGTTERIFDFARDAFGWIRGGLAQVNIGGNMIFAGMSGAALADLAGLGVVVVRAMTKNGYPAPFSAALTLAACVVGPIIPPSIILVIYGLATDTSVGKLFLAGVVPGVTIGISLMVSIWLWVRLRKPDWGKPEPFVLRRAVKSFRRGSLALLSPILIIGCILAGVATPSEIGAIAAGYALLIGIIHGDLTWPRLLACLKESVAMTAVIMYLIAVSSVMAWIVTTERVAHDAAQLMITYVQSPLIGLLLINIFLLIVGMFLETVPALLILSSILLPVVKALGIDPVHFGVIICYNLILGIITPPMGIGLFVAARVAKITPEAVLKASWPLYIPLLAALVIISVVPALSLWLPTTVYRWFGLS